MVDAMVRRAATRCAQRLLERNSTLHEAVQQDEHGALRELDDDLLCIIWQLFFADVVGEFILGVVSENIEFPALGAATATNGFLEWITNEIVDLIPNPCDERAKNTGERTSVAELARDLVELSIDHALGLDDGAPEVA